jgi:hypothetical protein
METQIISVNFSLYLMTLFVGSISVKNLLSKQGDNNTWNSQGFWDWQPTNCAGLPPPVAFYWHEKRTGGWSWQIDRNATHLLLAEKSFFFTKTAIGLTNVDREKLLNNASQSGYWIMAKEFGDDAGTWQLGGIRYDYPPKHQSIWDLVKGKLEIGK